MSFDYRAARKSILDSALPGPLRLLALCLVEHMPNCQPSIDRLASMCACDRRSVMRQLQSLERSGMVTVDRRMGQRNSYRLVTPVSPVTPMSPVAESDVTRDICDVSPVTFGAPTSDTGVTQSSLKQIQKADLKQQRGPLLSPVTRMSPVPELSLAPPVWHTLEGWVVPDELYAEAAMQGVTRKFFDERLAKLRNKRIGGKDGVLSRETHVRGLIPLWRTWGETDAAKAAQGVPAVPGLAAANDPDARLRRQAEHIKALEDQERAEGIQ